MINKAFYDEINDKILQLSPNGIIRNVLLEEHFKSELLRLSKKLKFDKWFPLILFLKWASLSQINSFEQDLMIVAEKTGLPNNKFAPFLSATLCDSTRWSGGFFESYIKSALLKNDKKIKNVNFNHFNLNGKNPDAIVKCLKKEFCIECTILSDSDEDLKAWDKYIEEIKSSDASSVLIRPGKYDDPNSKGPSPYYDCVRFYSKVFDKVAPKLNPDKGQLTNEFHNILMISFWTPRSGLKANSPGIGWALDELFADQPRGADAKCKTYDDNKIDTSLVKVILKAMKDNIINTSKFNDIIDASRKIGAIMLFDGCRFSGARINYNAYEHLRITHSELAFFEKIFNKPPIWDIYSVS